MQTASLLNAHDEAHEFGIGSEVELFSDAVYALAHRFGGDVKEACDILAGEVQPKAGAKAQIVGSEARRVFQKTAEEFGVYILEVKLEAVPLLLNVNVGSQLGKE